MSIIWKINNIDFKDLGVYVSNSDGLLGALATKKAKTYDWAEYHGTPYYQDKKIFDSREITLKCFILADNWLILKQNFDLFMSEFNRPGLQRFSCTPFDQKTLVYDVYPTGEVELNKTFRDEQMAATFSIKLVEPYPIKSVFSTISSSVQVKFFSDKFVRISFGDGTAVNLRGNVDFIRNYNTNLVEYGNYITQNVYGEYVQINQTGNKEHSFEGSAIFGDAGIKKMYLIGKIDTTYSVLAETSSVSVPGEITHFQIFKKVNPANYNKFIIKFSDGATNLEAAVRPAKVQPQNSPGTLKYIIVAGDIEEIENLTISNTFLVWEKL